MAKVQYYYAQKKKAESGAAGTVTYDLPTKDVIPEILVTVLSTPTSSTDHSLPLNTAITKIEIVDGAKIIKSLSGNQIRALEMIHDQHNLALTERDEDAVEGFGTFRILLAGIIDGVKYAPDFSRFSNPQIKISWDYSLVTTQCGGLVDADTAPAIKFTVLCKIVRDGGGYTHGYVRSSVIKTYTMAASATQSIEIPKVGKLLGIGIEAGYEGSAILDELNEIKLDFNSGDWIPFHFYKEEVLSSQKLFFGEPFSVAFQLDTEGAQTVDCHMGYIVDMGINNAETVERLTFGFPSQERNPSLLQVLDSTGGAYATYGMTSIKVTGYCPFNMWYVPMKHILNGDGDTIDIRDISEVDLKITSGATINTSSTPDVIAEFLITA